MTPRTLSWLIVAGLLTFGLCGCKATLNASVADSALLGADRSYFVVKRAMDGRGIDLLVRDQLRELGRSAECGDASSIGPETEVAVLYEDRWEWDMSDFLVSLVITFRDLETDQVIASGKSVRYSLSRKPPEEMVREVLAEVFSKAAGTSDQP